MICTPVSVKDVSQVHHVLIHCKISPLPVMLSLDTNNSCCSTDSANSSSSTKQNNAINHSRDSLERTMHLTTTFEFERVIEVAEQRYRRAAERRHHMLARRHAISQIENIQRTANTTSQNVLADAADAVEKEDIEIRQIQRDLDDLRTRHQAFKSQN